MKIYDIFSYSTVLSYETACMKSINAIQTFCSEQNVFIEDVFYHVYQTSDLEEDDECTGIILMVSLDYDKLMELKQEISTIINRHSDEDYSNWKSILKEINDLKEADPTK